MGHTASDRMMSISTLNGSMPNRNTSRHWVHPEAQPLTERSVSFCI